MKRFENSVMIGFEAFDNRTSKRDMEVLKTI